MPTRELLAAVVVEGVEDPILEFTVELFKRFFGISSSISLSGSLIRALINCVACLVDSVPPLQKGRTAKSASKAFTHIIPKALPHRTQPVFYHPNTNRKITLYSKNEPSTVPLQTITQEIQV